MDEVDPRGPDLEDPLIGEVRSFFAKHDPVPREVELAARAAFELRHIDRQIAKLLRDSALIDGLELAGVRGSGARSLTFACGESFIEIDIESRGPHLRVSGYVMPAAPGRITIERGDDSHELELDSHGRFSASTSAVGLVRFGVEQAGRPAFFTEWIAV